MLSPLLFSTACDCFQYVGVEKEGLETLDHAIKR